MLFCYCGYCEEEKLIFLANPYISFCWYSSTASPYIILLGNFTKKMNKPNDYDHSNSCTKRKLMRIFPSVLGVNCICYYKPAQRECRQFIWYSVCGSCI